MTLCTDLDVELAQRFDGLRRQLFRISHVSPEAAIELMDAGLGAGWFGEVDVVVRFAREKCRCDGHGDYLANLRSPNYVLPPQPTRTIIIAHPETEGQAKSKGRWTARPHSSIAPAPTNRCGYYNKRALGGTGRRCCARLTLTPLP